MKKIERNELISKIKHLVYTQDILKFNMPIPFMGKTLESINKFGLVFENRDAYMLIDELEKEQLGTLLFIIEQQIESNKENCIEFDLPRYFPNFIWYS